MISSDSIGERARGDNLQLAVFSHFGAGDIDSVTKAIQKGFGCRDFDIDKISKWEYIININYNGRQQKIFVLFKKGFVVIKVD